MDPFSISPEMVSRYISNRRKDLEQLKESILIRNFSFIASKAHNLKGTAESFGFPELGLIGTNLESAALENDELATAEQVKKFESWLQTHLTK